MQNAMSSPVLQTIAQVVSWLVIHMNYCNYCSGAQVVSYSYEVTRDGNFLIFVQSTFGNGKYIVVVKRSETGRLEIQKKAKNRDGNIS